MAAQVEEPTAKLHPSKDNEMGVDNGESTKSHGRSSILSRVGRVDPDPEPNGTDPEPNDTGPGNTGTGDTGTGDTGTGYCGWSQAATRTGRTGMASQEGVTGMASQVGVTGKGFSGSKGRKGGKAGKGQKGTAGPHQGKGAHDGPNEGQRPKRAWQGTGTQDTGPPSRAPSERAPKKTKHPPKALKDQGRGRGP